MNVLLVLLSVFVFVVNSAKILVIFPTPAGSHYILGNALTRILVEGGHDVTFISPREEKNPPKNGTWTDIVLTGMFESRDGTFGNLYDLENINPYLTIPFMNFMTTQIAEETLKHEAVQKLLKSNQKFDIVITEQFMNYVFQGFAHHFGASSILFHPVAAISWVNKLVANPAPPSYVPELSLSYYSPMTFFQRVNNVLFQIVSNINDHLFTYPAHQKLLDKYFPNAPPLEDLLYNASLVFVNSDLGNSLPVPKVPSMIDVGAYHIQPPKKLPAHIQEFLDTAKHGVIYFSMGSNLKSPELPQAKKDAFLKVFSKLKQKVLWKWEEDNLPGQPPNVQTGKWLPQTDILAHPNVILFITHGGFTSTTETIYHGVPVLAIPIFGDQKANAQQAVLGGYGLTIPFSQVNEETLSNSLNELLNNPKYTENVKTRSRILRDQITTPQQRIRFWVDYVARHKGATHLRVEGLKLPWYKYLVLDVFAFLISCVTVFALFLVFILKKLFCKNKNKSKLKTN